MKNLREKLRELMAELECVFTECQRQGYASRAREFQEQAMNSLQVSGAKVLRNCQ